VSASAEKKKKGEEDNGPLRDRIDGPLGRWAEKVKGKFFLFLFFFFKLLFKTIFSFQIQTKFFQTFSQKFYKLFRSHTSNQKPCKAK
jgi:hypothetical protein